MRTSDWSSDVCSSDLEPSLQHMVRRVAGPDAATGKSCCRSGFSRELLLGPQGSRLPPLLQGQMPGSRAQAAVIDVFTQSRPLALAAYRDRKSTSLNSSH